MHLPWVHVLNNFIPVFMTDHQTLRLKVTRNKQIDQLDFFIIR